MVIDSHQHVFWMNHDDAWLVREMDELGIDRAWLLTWYLTTTENDPSYHIGMNPLHARHDGTHAAMPLVDVLKARNRYPGRFVAGYCPCPTEGNAPALFESAYHMHGVRVCGEWSYRTLLDDPRSLELFHKVGKLGCPVVLHLDVPYLPTEMNGKPVYHWRWYGGGDGPLERALLACPETIFIGHSPGFWRYISGDAEASPETYPPGPIAPGGRLITLFETYSNLYADLSAGSGLNALQRNIEHGREFLVRYADRLLFGRDQYGDQLMQFLETLSLPAEVREKIFSANALRLVPPA